jgi:hypothetical protein
MMISPRRVSTAALLPVLLAGAAGCVSRPPSVAHVHLGHAITGVHVTPDHQGYIVTAEHRARETIEYTTKASGSQDLDEIKREIAAAFKATNSQDDFGVRESIVMAVNHVSFAATSDDASLNVQKSAPQFAADSAHLVERCDLIALLSKDVATSGSVKEASVSVTEIAKLAQANLSGEDGVLALRKELEAMIAREKPPYVTVDQWYLFNLVRLPNGKWVFDKFGRGGNIEGYK